MGLLISLQPPTKGIVAEDVNGELAENHRLTATALLPIILSAMSEAERRFFLTGVA